MSPITIIPVEDIINENYRLTGVECDEGRKRAITACYSSFYYYPTHKEQIASIVVSLVKAHFFIDGNKRTALSTYLVLAQVNGIKYIDDVEEQVKVFVEIASSHKSIQEYSTMLFPG